MEPDERLEAIAEDRSSGASEITEDALALYQTLAADAEDPVATIAEAGARLIGAHPAMAPLVTATSQVLEAVREEGAGGVDRVRALRRARARQAAEHGADRIPEDGVVATYSRSGTVLAAIRRALKRSIPFRLVAAESRPGEEGVELARQVARMGPRVTLTADAGLMARMDRVDVLLVGADALCRAGLVNKTGTGALAREAARADTPAYVVATTDKLMPPVHRARPPLTARGHLGHGLPEGVREAAALFECTALAPFEAVVSEEGPLGPDAIDERLDEARLDPALAERL